MTVISAMESFTCERHGLFTEVRELGLAIQAKLRGLGYGE
jgi:hypothetical protein